MTESLLLHYSLTHLTHNHPQPLLGKEGSEPTLLGKEGSEPPLFGKEEVNHPSLVRRK